MANWMTELPTRLHKVPIREISIPGSHDSGAFYLELDSPIAPGEPSVIKNLAKLGRCAKKVIYNWSITQHLTITQQLNSGIRYLDIRTAYDKGKDDFFVVHGLYGLKTSQILQEVKDFIDTHPKEVIILDFNHLLNITGSLHDKLVKIILNLFKGKLCGSKQGIDVTLEQAWHNNTQIIACYHDSDITAKYKQFWASDTIYSPWPDTSSTSKLQNYLSTRFNDVKASSFNVFQAILTPSTGTITLHLTGSLYSTLGLKADGVVRNWLDQVLAQKKKGVNIVMCDFIDSKKCVEATLKLNAIL